MLFLCLTDSHTCFYEQDNCSRKISEIKHVSKDLSLLVGSCVCLLNSSRTSSAVMSKIPGEIPQNKAKGTQELKGTLPSFTKSPIEGNIVVKSAKLQLPVLNSTPCVESSIGTSLKKTVHLSCHYLVMIPIFNHFIFISFLNLNFQC